MARVLVHYTSITDDAAVEALPDGRKITVACSRCGTKCPKRWVMTEDALWWSVDGFVQKHGHLDPPRVLCTLSDEYALKLQAGYAAMKKGKQRPVKRNKKKVKT